MLQFYEIADELATSTAEFASGSRDAIRHLTCDFCSAGTHADRFRLPMGNLQPGVPLQEGTARIAGLLGCSAAQERQSRAGALSPITPSASFISLPLRSGFPMADLAWSKPARQARWSSCRLGCKFSNFLLCSQGLLIFFNTL